MVDLVIEAETILTLDRERPRAQRMGLKKGRIIGFDEQLDGFDLRNTPVASHPRRTIVPGFIDAHCHTTWWGLGLNGIPVGEARGLDELYDMLRDAVAGLGEGEWVYGIGFSEMHHDGQMPDLAVVDEITGEHPMYIRNLSGHASLTNTATLRMVGAFEDDFEPPEGGVVVRDADGNYTGLVEETAQGLLQEMILPYSHEQIVAALDSATREYAAQGITSFTEAGVGGGWIGHSPVEVAAYQLAADRGRLHARAQLMPALDALDHIEGADADYFGHGSASGLSLGLRTGFGNDQVGFGPVKVFTDGSLLGRTASVTESFCGHNHNLGYLLTSPEELHERVGQAYRAGWNLAIHAIGDAAIDVALDLIEQCQEQFGLRAAPNRIEHFGISRPDQIERAARLNVAVTPQHGFIHLFGAAMVERVGEHRRELLYRGRSLVDAGVIVAGSSDSPVCDVNVRRAMQAAVDRVSEDGSVIGESEGFTREQALRLYTEWGAIATGTIADRGTLSVGKLGDFVVLDASPLEAERLDELRVEATYMGGVVTHEVVESTTEKPATIAI